MVDKLIGVGQKFNAETCLFVSWAGFKSNVQKEIARDFFRVRLWSRKELLEKLFTHYDKLPEEMRLALPLEAGLDGGGPGAGLNWEESAIARGQIYAVSA